MESSNVSPIGTSACREKKIQLPYERVLRDELETLTNKQVLLNSSCNSVDRGRFQDGRPHSCTGPSKRVAPRNERKIEVSLDLKKSQVVETRLRLYVGEKNVAVQSSAEGTLEDSQAKILSELNSVMLHGCNVDGTSFVSTQGQVLKKVLVRPVGNRDLEITAAVILDTNSGKETRVAVEKIVLCGSPTSGFAIEPPCYTLRQHIQDLCSGFLRADFYEKINEQGYGLTIRSLARHLLNDFEALVGASDIKLAKPSIASNDQSRSTLNGLSCLSQSFLRNMYVDGTMCTFGKVHSNSRGMPNFAVSAQCQDKACDDHLLNNKICKTARRKLGIDNNFSIVESSTIIGVAAIGLGLSFLYARQRPSIARNVSGTRLYPVGLSSSNNSVYSSLRESLKRLL